jgi:Holliday junction resolvase RusA-like endonuclease
VIDPPSSPVLDFWVPGKTEPQGSAEAHVIYKNRAKKVPARRPDGSILVNVTSDNPALKAWRQKVAAAATTALTHAAVDGLPPEPVEKPTPFVVHSTFFLQRPESHYRSGRNAHLISDGARAFPVTIPDVDKLERAIFDALTDVVYVDDSQVIDAINSKRYAVPTPGDDGVGVRIVVRRVNVQLACDLPPQLRQRPNAEHAPSMAESPATMQRALFDAALM